MADRQFVIGGVQSAPADWILPASLEIMPRTACATFDGSAAAGSFLPCLEIISDSGHVVGIYRTADPIAAGGSAIVSWFPGADVDAAVTTVIPGTGVETLYLDTTAASVSASTVLASGTTYLIAVQGTFSVWNTALTNGTPEANAMFPGSTAGRVSTQVGVDADTVFANPPSVPDLGHYNRFEIMLDGATWGHVEPTGGPFSVPQAGHLYYFSVVGQGHAPSFRVRDTPLSDNYGLLQIVIQDPGGAGGGGNGTLVPVPTTAQNGYALLASSGVPTWQSFSAGGTISDLTSSAGTITVSSPTGPTTNVDLPTTGVTPGSYGDASDVAQVTVDSRGRITAASSVPIAGGGAVVASDGWVPDTTETWTFASFTAGPPAVGTFTVAGDLRAKYTVGTRIKLVQTTTKYFVVSADPTYDGVNTTVTVTAGTDYTLANAAISGNYHSYVANPQGYPGWFNFAAAAAGFSAKTSDVGKFAMVGRLVVVIPIIIGTSNATTFTYSLPVTPADSVLSVGAVTNSGATVLGRCVLAAGSSTATFSVATLTNAVAGSTITVGTGAFTNSGTKACNASLVLQYDA